MYDDLDRPPLRAAALARALEAEGWQVEVAESATSTQELARGRTPMSVVVAEHQSHGRGRLDRTWTSPARAGLTFSTVLRPRLVDGWIPLLSGLAVANAIGQHCELDAVLKWPNDILIGGRKVCGLLAEVNGQDVTVGIGLNVTTREHELPVDTATSLQLQGAAVTDRETLLKAVLRELRTVIEDRPLASYRERCSTVGQMVRLLLPGAAVVEGVAEAVDEQGRLVVDGVGYAAGDVVHLRG